LYTLFFDNFVSIGAWQSVKDGVRCEQRQTLAGISSMDGTSMTIMLSENLDAGHWVWYAKGEPQIPMATHWYSIPTNLTKPATGPWTVDLKNSLFVVCPNDMIESFPGDLEAMVGFCFPTNASGPEDPPPYIPLDSGGLGLDTEQSPLFVNEGRAAHIGTQIANRGLGRTARPSSEHPGVVVTTYCDGSVRSLRDNVEPTLFVRLCRPGSGVVLNPKDLFD
jgi:hypothetical protein